MDRNGSASAIRCVVTKRKISVTVVCGAPCGAAEMAGRILLATRPVDFRKGMALLAELGGADNADITEKELKAKAAAAGIHWQVVSYALSRQWAGHERRGAE